MSVRGVSLLFAVALQAAASPVLANGLGENVGWQFQTTADRVNRAVLEDLRQKKVTGFYGPPNITNNIGKQFNCNVTASSTGNIGSNALSSAAPVTSGNGAYATGNANQSAVQNGSTRNGDTGQGNVLSRTNGTDWSLSADGAQGSDIWTSQANLGAVQSTAQGDVSSVMGDSHNYQALNSNQSSSGAQTASVASSTGCSFATVN